MDTFTQYDFRTSFVQMAEDSRSLHAWMANILTRGSLDAPDYLPAGSHVADPDHKPVTRFTLRRTA